MFIHPRWYDSRNQELSETGFKVVKVIPTKPMMSYVEFVSTFFGLYPQLLFFSTSSFAYLNRPLSMLQSLHSHQNNNPYQHSVRTPLIQAFKNKLALVSALQYHLHNMDMSMKTWRVRDWGVSHLEIPSLAHWNMSQPAMNGLVMIDDHPPKMDWIYFKSWRALCGRIHAHDCPRLRWRAQVRRRMLRQNIEEHARIKHQRSEQHERSSCNVDWVAIFPAVSFQPSAQIRRWCQAWKNAKVWKGPENHSTSENNPKQKAWSLSVAGSADDTASQQLASWDQDATSNNSWMKKISVTDQRPK